MILLIDIGNTSIAIGIQDRNEIKALFRMKTVCNGRSHEEIAYIMQGVIRNHHAGDPDGAALCSVVPAVTPMVVRALNESFNINPLCVSSSVATGLKFLIKNPEELGADRIANAAAAYHRYKDDVIVVDFGTATTICAVTDKGEYTGGAIMPGIALCARMLGEETARLPTIELKAPDTVLGKTTEENIRSGVVVGHAGAVERIIEDIKIERGKNFTVIATGGYGDLVTPYISSIDSINPHLTLEGLNYIYELNS